MFYTITSDAGTYTGTLAEVCAWQAEHQGECPSITDGTTTVTVYTWEVDFDDSDAPEIVLDLIEQQRRSGDGTPDDEPDDEGGAPQHVA